MKLIVGLGNPGKEYQDTRHNIGWQMLDFLKSESDASSDSWKFEKKCKSELAQIQLGNEKVLLAKPQTFMNASGDAVSAIAAYYHISPEDIWVIHDELDLPFRTFKIQADRGAASHNGVESIISKLKTKSFHRVRIGISPSVDKRPQNSKAFVLKKFSVLERYRLKKLFGEVREAIIEQI